MNNKKSIIALLLIAIIGIVGLTTAYFANDATITNEFETNPYGTTFTEVFESPDNWTSGTTTPKTLTVTNTGNVDEAVRVSYTETWTSANAQEEGDLALSQNGNTAAIINWANISDWTIVTENGTTYKYYNYKLAPNESTSDLLNSVTFNSAITNDENCVTSNNGQAVTCTSTGDGYDGATYKLTFHIETVQYDKYATAWGTEVEIAAEKPLPAAQYLATNATNPVNTGYNDTGADKGNMFIFTHTLNEGTENETTVTESRYIGDVPKNYVYFNCDEPQEGVEYNYATSCEVWRILGVFDVDDGTGNVEKRMKLVRGSEFASSVKWNTNSNDFGYNDWLAENTTLRLLLNGAYFNNTGEALSNGYGLKELARNMIGDAVYHLGSFDWSSSLTTEQLYSSERGNVLCGSCNNDNTKLTWTGKVGLMYPSDEYMVYGNGVNTNCYNTPSNSVNCNSTNAQTGWVYNSNQLSGSIVTTWFLSPCSGDSHTVFISDTSGYLRSTSAYSGSVDVRPVVYLKSNVKIIDGTGQSTNPYKIELMQ